MGGLFRSKGFATKTKPRLQRRRGSIQVMTAGVSGA